jgi:hypothetical protein
MNANNFRLKKLPAVAHTALALGIAATAASIWGGSGEPRQFFHSALVACVLWTGVALGALFFTLLHHVVGSTWSVVLRRFSETAGALFPLCALFTLPALFFGLHHLYPWADPATVADDPLLLHKARYLNAPFFLGRAVFYFAVWSLLGALLLGISRRQDADASRRKGFPGLAAFGLIAFAFTVTFAAFDWIMSMDPHWHSTMFGVLLFSGSVVAGTSFLILTVFTVRSTGALRGTVTPEHDHDLGKFLFAFVCFWAYIAFSQYMLIWYGNIPDETVWYRHRLEGGWAFMGPLLAVGHFALPFLLLLPRRSKRTPGLLVGMSLWLIAMHAAELHWLVMPALHTHGFHFHWLDLSTIAATGGLFTWAFFLLLARSPLVPVNDPKLEASIHITN